MQSTVMTVGQSDCLTGVLYRGARTSCLQISQALFQALFLTFVLHLCLHFVMVACHYMSAGSLGSRISVRSLSSRSPCVVFLSSLSHRSCSVVCPSVRRQRLDQSSELTAEGQKDQRIRHNENRVRVCDLHSAPGPQRLRRGYALLVARSFGSRSVMPTDGDAACCAPPRLLRVCRCVHVFCVFCELELFMTQSVSSC